ncbi:hypothetical protein TGAM01_v209966 [Trichoderma gamsii]|uniref:Uncharacterized protein n=1 Tax=Trichoderma gamsii TaxID=398673 RepID=A0A2P4Z9Y5_9HYPO|nr:hypothetical protein TGAM01_v209966 [Trichoderma gamsii]PON21118.1 hypothetical protein TGAM01_v209966 [Trichoderma gamsii]
MPCRPTGDLLHASARRPESLWLLQQPAIRLSSCRRPTAGRTISVLAAWQLHDESMREGPQ